MSGNSSREQTPLVLVVDDDATMRILIRHALRKAGFEVIEASDGGAALDLFQTQRPDTVLLDVMMPNMDGYTVCHTMRNTPGAEHTPIFMVTGLDDVASIDEAYQAGATDFITKPITYPLLGHRIRYVLRASRAMRDLNKSQTRLAHAQALARVGNWEWDLVRDRFLCSSEIFRILGLSLEETEFNRQDFLRAIHPHDLLSVTQTWNNAVQYGRPYSIDHRIIQPLGRERIVHQQGEAIRDDLQRIVQINGTLQDITERKQVENELKQYRNHLEELVEKRTLELTVTNSRLQEAKEQAEKANSLKDKFISLVAHDLRSPLSGMISALEYMASDEETPLNMEHQDIVERLITIGKSSVHLIEDVLNISRIKTGKLKPECDWLDLRQKIDKNIHKLNFLAQQKGILLVNEMPEDVLIYADPSLLGEVIQNLASNAIKFCHRGNWVRFYLAHREPYVLAVEDNGVGIATEKLPRLFRIEEKTSTTGTAGEQGTGFGLPFCYDIMVAHGGSITVKSTEGEGTIFFVHFPLDSSTAED
jgi:two-component system, cell cycle sensor histidine kinase PleC